ncbi:N-acetylmuramoyl-L-alanine amidase [Bacillus sp. L_1B0_8]|nr:N-acetylmuramoyl-L-alanine amidase [Bacillus sp. L_1B0_5]KIQ81224.1 N-acetylmuramoyl-L-alanine amidase [Bacillus sp. L_1B0_8]
MDMVKVWLDAGHGAHDSGAVGHSLLEKNIVLELALSTYEYLNEHYDDIIVGMTRFNDTFKTLQERCNMANQFGADIFVSFHCNSGATNGVPGNGFETFRFPGTTGDTLRLQQVTHHSIFSFYAKHGLRNRGMKEASFAVLRGTNMPAVLTENLFMNHTEILKFNNATFLYHVAEAHAHGIAEYFGLKPKVDKNKLVPIYQIHLGDFNSIEWTADTLRKVKEIFPGYGVWTKCLEGNAHRIILGDFSGESWADDTLSQLQGNFPDYGAWKKRLN